MADRLGTSCKIFLSNRCWLAYGPLLHTPLPWAMPAIPFSEVLRQGPGLPSDAYQPQRQVRSSGLSQRGWGAEQSRVLPWCSGIFLFQEPCPNPVRKAHSLSFSLALFLFLSLIHTYHTSHHQRQKGKSPYWLVSCGSCRMKGCTGTSYNWPLVFPDPKHPSNL